MFTIIKTIIIGISSFISESYFVSGADRTYTVFAELPAPLPPGGCCYGGGGRGGGETDTDLLAKQDFV